LSDWTKLSRPLPPSIPSLHEERRNLVRLHRHGEQEAPAARAAEALEVQQLVGRLDPLRDHLEVAVRGHDLDRLHDVRDPSVDPHVGDEAAVDLDRVDRQSVKHAERLEALDAAIVDREHGRVGDRDLVVGDGLADRAAGDAPDRAASRQAMIQHRRLQLAVSRAWIIGHSRVSPPCHPGESRRCMEACRV
jgi:hypothetical protein